MIEKGRFMIGRLIKNIVNGSSRSAKFKKNIILMIIIQFLNVLVSFLLVPITLNYIGAKEYGVWITLVNIISWFVFFDIGFSHGLRNKYVESKASGNIVDTKKYVSTTFFSLFGISLSIFLIYLIFAPFINWSYLLNAPASLEDDLKNLCIVLIGVFSLRLVLSIVTTLITADQEPSISAAINFSGQLLSLASIYIITETTNTSLLYLGVALTVSQVLPLLVAFIYFFNTKYRSLFPSWDLYSKEHLSSIFSLGSRFFLIQLTALVLFQSNNIIIAHTAGLVEVAEFNIAFRYINISYIAFSTFLNPLWSASTDAYVRNDLDWITNSMRKLKLVWVLLIVGGGIMVAVSPIIYKLWLENEFVPNFSILLLTLFYFVFLAKSTMYRSFMNGVGKITLQFYVTLCQALLHVPLAFILGKNFGIVGVLGVMITWSLINSIWEKIQFNKIVNRTAVGVWFK